MAIILQMIAELGGVTALARFVLRVYSDLVAEKNTPPPTTIDRISNELIEQVMGVFAICCALILLAPTILPMLFTDVEGVYLLAKNKSFLFFEWSSLKEYSWGTEGANRRFILLPYQIAFCTNFISFFLTGRALKK